MHLQGNLQTVFDALYQLGVIDPVLEMDWKVATKDRLDYSRRVCHAIEVVNRCQESLNQLIHELEKLDDKTLSFLAMEVARELADYRGRKWLH
jgi:hypothetical protein